jgi:hypothetical protein
LLCPNPPSRRTSLLAAYFYSQGCIRILKDGFKATLRRFSENRWRALTTFPLEILDIFSSSGSGAGVAASTYRGTNLMLTKVSNLYECFK